MSGAISPLAAFAGREARPEIPGRPALARAGGDGEYQTRQPVICIYEKGTRV